MNLKLITFFTLVLVSYTIEKLQVQCKNKDSLIKREILSILHHILVIWLYFGTFIFRRYYVVHLLSLLFIYSQWQVLETIYGYDYCIISKVYNDMCGIDLKDGFKDLRYSIEGKEFRISYLIMIYDLYFISKGNI